MWKPTLFLELFSPERKNRSFTSCAVVIRSLFLLQFGNISRIVRQSFIVVLSGAQKRFSVPCSLMPPAVERPIDLRMGEREGIGRVRTLEISNCFTFRRLLLQSRKRHGDSFVSIVSFWNCLYSLLELFNGSSRYCLGTRT